MLPPNAIFSAESAALSASPLIVAVGEEISIRFIGDNTRDGDFAKWLPQAEGGVSCDGAASTKLTIVENQAATFRFESVGRHVLCYKWNFDGLSYPSSAFVAFDDVVAIVVEVSTVSPVGTAIGCASNLTIHGAGLELLPAGSPLACSFGWLGSTPLTLLSDSLASCLTPTGGAFRRRLDESGEVSEQLPLSLRVGEGDGLLLEASILEAFEVYDPFHVRIDTASPAGGSYNLPADVALTGRFLRFGPLRCRFGPDFLSTAATMSADGTAMVCAKPRFPDSYRDEVGTLALQVAPNGQCFAESSAEFTTYNAAIKSISLLGAPSNTAVTLVVTGVGFVLGLEGHCRFTLQDSATGETKTTALQVLSPTSATCSTPAAGITGQWEVTTMLNGLAPEPSLYGFPVFSEYNLSTVRVHGVSPPGGPEEEAISVVLHGTNFFHYGEGQLVVSVATQQGGAPLLLRGTLLDSTRVLCTLPAGLSAGTVRLGISLNNGTQGTFSADDVGLKLYKQPTLLGVLPDEGDANGGSTVTITGSGFGALGADRSLFRCGFGGTTQHEPPSFLNDTHAICVTTWGKDVDEGQPVSVALNGVSFYEPSGDFRVPYFFVGLHKPALIDVYFPPEATTLVVLFDSQATNRGGMNGLAPCSDVLDEDTVATIRGTAPDPPECSWSDDSTLVVLLSIFTDAAPGMRVGVKAGVIWPQLWSKGSATWPSECGDNPCGCVGDGVDEEALLCSAAQELSIDADFPCDLRGTTEREPCALPQALIQAPSEI